VERPLSTRNQTFAAVTAVAAVGTAQGDELLATEGEAAASAVAGLDMDFDFYSTNFMITTCLAVAGN